MMKNRDWRANGLRGEGDDDDGKGRDGKEDEEIFRDFIEVKG